MAGTTLTTLNGEIVAQEAIVAASKAITPIKDFAHRFTEAESARGSVVTVPIFSVPTAKEFNATTADYTTGDGTASGVDIALTDHLFSGFNFTDTDFAQCPVAFWRGGGEAIGKAIGKAISEKVLGVINKTNIAKDATHEIVLATVTKAAIAKLTASCDAVDVDPAQATLLLAPGAFADLIAVMDAYVYGGPEAVRSGDLAPGCYGFGKIRRCNALTTASGENLVGAIVADDALGYGCSPLEPQAKAALDEYGFATDEGSGLTIGFRRFGTVTNGKNYMVGEVLLGKALLQPSKIVRLVSSATSAS